VAVPPAPDDSPGVTDDSDLKDPTAEKTPSTGASPRFRLGLLVVLIVLLVALTAAVAYLGATRATAHLGMGGEQEQLQAEREAVMSQSEQFMLRVNTYGPGMLEGEQMPEFRSNVEEVITPKFSESFDESAKLAEQTVVQFGVSRTSDVFSTGVSLIDSDSATALAAGQIINSFPDEKNPDELVAQPPQQFRVEVKLVKIDGEWLVDDFAPITGADDSAAPEGQAQ
jgi:Mce-associated membrane protein